ncbi:MAG: MerR family transcriptional regulator [Mycobacteriales bacterium]
MSQDGTKGPGAAPGGSDQHNDRGSGPGGSAASPATNPAAQPSLFSVDRSPAGDDNVGYRGTTACTAAGITYRQLDYWARTALVAPTVRGATGSGSQRLYSFTDILVLKVVKRLLDTGISLRNIRTAAAHLRARGVEDLATLTLVSDGTTIYECTSAEEVVDVLAGGQGVFGIAVSGALRELTGSLATLPAEPAGGAADVPVRSDELAARRQARLTG